MKMLRTRLCLTVLVVLYTSYVPMMFCTSGEPTASQELRVVKRWSVWALLSMLLYSALGGVPYTAQKGTK